MRASDDEPTDVVYEAERLRAREAARERALAPPPRPRRRHSGSAVDAYVQTAIDRECEALARAEYGTRNDQLNESAFNLGQLVGADVLDRSRAEMELSRATKLADNVPGHPFRGPEVKKTMRSGLDAGELKPRDMSDVGQVKVRAPVDKTADSKAAAHSGGAKAMPDDPDDVIRRCNLKFFNQVKSYAPQFVWEHDEEGVLQLGTLCLFAGRPSAGKSTATRWLAAQLSNGTLPGIWHGHPVNVALFTAEEQHDVTVATSLIAAGAELSRVAATLMKDGETESMLRAIGDELALTEELCDNGIRCLIVDPIIETFDSKADMNQNNVVREYLHPYQRIAKAINGIVIGVVHLRKNGTRNVMEDITGSSAFGEVARSIIGFAEQAPDEPLRIVEQVKNSVGPSTLRMNYRLTIEDVDTDDGMRVSATRFELAGPSDLSIADLGGVNDEEADQVSANIEWLQRYLEIEQPAPSAQVKRDAKDQAGIGENALHRARKKLKVKSISMPRDKAPHSRSWCLPDWEQ